REEGPHDGEALAPGREPAEQLPLLPLADDADLRVIAPEVAVDLAERRLPGEHRARDDPRRHVRIDERALDAGLEARAEPGPEEPRLAHERSAERDHASDRDPTGAEELAERDHVLVADVPDYLPATYGIEEVDVRARQPRGM